MKRLLLLLAFLYISSANAQQTVSTFILVRHAEKATADAQKMMDMRDPDLSEAGKLPMLRLVALLK